MTRRTTAFLVSQAFVNVGGRLTQIAVFWSALSLGGTALSVGALGASWTFVMAVVGLVSGSLADRFSRKTLLIVLESLLGILSLSIAMLAFFDALDLWHLWAFLLLESILGTPVSMAFSALLPDMISEARLLRLNAVFGSWGQIDNLVEAALAGVVLGIWGPAPLFLIHGVTYLIGALGAFLAVEPRSQPHHASDSRWTPVSDLRVTVAFLRSKKLFLKNILLEALEDLCYAPLYFVAPLVAASVGSGPEGYGFFEGLMMVGMLVASLAASTVASHLPKVKTWLIGTGLYSMAFAFLGFRMTYSTALVAFFVVGLGMVGGRIYGKTLVQQALPSTVRGRITGASWFLTGILQPASVALAMMLVDRGSLSTILISLGLAMTGLTIVRAVLLPLADAAWIEAARDLCEVESSH